MRCEFLSEFLMLKEGHREQDRELFEKFCRGKYLDPNHTSKSKTVTEEKVHRR